jgi:hypothetical protein
MMADGVETERSAFTVNEFCSRNHISRGLYFNMRKAGIGPAEMRIGHVVRVSAEAELEWQRARTTPSGAELALVEEAKASLTARGKRAGDRAAASPRHVSRTRPRRRAGGAR